MQKCPRCQYEIEGAAQATCPICFTPLAAAPAVAAMAPSIGISLLVYGSAMPCAQPTAPPPAPPMSQPYGARVSLTGEVIGGPSANVQPSSLI